MNIHGDRYEYSTACLGSVEFRTNGPQGGDSGHGGFLEVTFETHSGSTALDVQIDGGEEKPVVNTLVLTFRGDAEMNAAREMFAFLASSL